MAETQNMRVQDSKERVAFDLMEKIAYYTRAKEAGEDPEGYFLNLYYRCLDTVYGKKPGEQKR